MKKKLAIAALMMILSAPAFAGWDESKCPAGEVNREMPNPLVKILAFPFELVAAITYMPLCALKNIPKNEPAE